MSSRRIILVFLLVALGLSAVTAIFAITAGSDQIVFQIIMAAIVTALAAGLLLPLTLLTDRPTLRLTGFLAMGVVVLSWLSALFLIYLEGPGISSRWRWEDALAFSFIFTLITGIPAVGFSLLQRYRWARFAVPAFLAAAGLAWLFTQVAATAIILLPNPLVIGGRSVRPDEHLLLTACAVYGLGFAVAALLVNFRCGDRRHFRFVGIAVAALALVLFLFAIWLPLFQGGRYRQSDNIARFAFFFSILAGVLAFINLFLMARLRDSQHWLQMLTIGLTVLAGALATPLSFSRFYGPTFETLARASIAVTVAVGSAGIALIVLSMLNRKPPATLAPGALTATDITLFCPRCQTKQTLPLGDAACKTCELLLSIKAVEPRCPACGYLLYQLTSNKCPECGAPVREANAPPPMPLSSP
jgi:hypothetical protein